MNRPLYHMGLAYVLCCLMIPAANGQLQSPDPYQRDSAPQTQPQDRPGPGMGQPRRPGQGQRQGQGGGQGGRQGEPQQGMGQPGPQGGMQRGASGGQGGGASKNPVILALDTNRDGELSASEIANAAASLKTLDKNGDGNLSRDEMRPENGGQGQAAQQQGGQQQEGQRPSPRRGFSDEPRPAPPTTAVPFAGDDQSQKLSPVEGFALKGTGTSEIQTQRLVEIRSGSVPRDGVLKSGPLPDLNAFTADGEPIKLRSLASGSYTVLKAGCLTCPEFHRGYPELEAANADYSAKGVKFYYFYKSLRHPELDGYVQAQNIQERLLQLAEARTKLGTKAPWIADTIDDSIRIGLRSGSNSVYLISPEGEIIYAADKFDGDELRAALTEFVGPVERTTPASSLGLPILARQSRATNVDSNLRVARPEGMVILSITPTTPSETYYIKLRAEAEPELLRTGKGRLFLGFYPDPILDAHWNNLTPPMKYVLQLPEGVTADPVEASAAKGTGDSDTEPRQFWVDVQADKTPGDFKLSLHYYACAPDMCKAMTHEYIISFVPENRGANTYGFNRGQRGGQRGTQASQRKGQPGQ